MWWRSERKPTPKERAARDARDARAQWLLEELGRTNGEPESRPLIDELAHIDPGDPIAALAAQCGYEDLGDEAEALIQTAFMLAMDLPCGYHCLAEALRKRGDEERADPVMAAGWERAKQRYPRRDWARARRRFYGEQDLDPPRRAPGA